MKQLFAAISVVLLLSGCSPNPPKTVYPQLNREAEVHGGLSWNPRSGRVITSWINPGGTMTTLYGDDAAVIAIKVKACPAVTSWRSIKARLPRAR